MKELLRFLKKIFQFLLIPILLWLIWSVVFFYLPNNYLLKKKMANEQISDTNVLILGSSHTLAGINPEFFDKKTLNLANSGQDFYYDSELIKKYLSQDKQLEAVILDASYLSFEYRESKGSSGCLGFFYEVHFDIPNEDSKFYLSHQVPDLLNRQTATLSKLIKNKFHPQEPILNQSGFETRPNYQEINQQNALKKIKSHHKEMSVENLIENVKILTDLIDTLEEEKIKVILVTPPASQEYNDNMDPQKYKRMQKVIKYFSQKGQIYYFNYLFDQRFNNEDFSDVDHLNIKGAEKFSNILNIQINQLLDQNTLLDNNEVIQSQ